MDFNFNLAQNSFKELHLIGFNLQIFVWHRINAEQLCRVVNYDSKVFIRFVTGVGCDSQIMMSIVALVDVPRDGAL